MTKKELKVTMRTCKCCNKSKPMKEFPFKHTHSGSYHLHTCTSCYNEQHKKYNKSKDNIYDKRITIHRPRSNKFELTVKQYQGW